MKVKAPEGVTSCSHDGVQYDVDEHGHFEVDDNAHHTHKHFIELGFSMEESAEVKAEAAKKEAEAKAAAEAAAAAKKEADEKAAAEKKAAKK